MTAKPPKHDNRNWPFQRSKRPLVVAFWALSSCGSGSDAVEPIPTALDEMNASASSLISSFTPVEYTDLSLIPTTGTAGYSGFILGQLSNTDDDVTDTMIGELSIQVSFSEQNMVSGVASSFLDENGNPMTGEISISGGVLDRAGDTAVDATFAFEGSGELVDLDGRAIQLDAAFEGDFLGESANGIGGDVLGQVTVDGTGQSFGGIFIAEIDGPL
jgi:hypothetical protein